MSVPRETTVLFWVGIAEYSLNFITLPDHDVWEELGVGGMAQWVRVTAVYLGRPEFKSLQLREKPGVVTGTCSPALWAETRPRDQILGALWPSRLADIQTSENGSQLKEEGEGWWGQPTSSSSLRTHQRSVRVDEFHPDGSMYQHNTVVWYLMKKKSSRTKNTAIFSIPSWELMTCWKRGGIFSNYVATGGLGGKKGFVGKWRGC